MAFNGYFIPTHSNPVDITIKITPYVIATHSNSFQPIPTHFNSFQFIPTHSNPVDISIKISPYVIATHFNSFQPISTHSNPFKSCCYVYQNRPLRHCNYFQFIPTHPNTFQFIPIEFISIQLKFVSKSPFAIAIYSNSFLPNPTHSYPFQSC